MVEVVEDHDVLEVKGRLVPHQPRAQSEHEQEVEGDDGEDGPRTTHQRPGVHHGVCNTIHTSHHKCNDAKVKLCLHDGNQSLEQFTLNKTTDTFLL